MSERRSPITLTTGAAVAAKRLIKMSAGTAVHNTVTHTDDPIGTSEIPAANGDVVSIRLLSEEGTLEITAGGAISAGADVYAGADGKVTALSAAAGTYRKVGVAMEAATADGDIIEFLPYDYHATATVTE